MKTTKKNKSLSDFNQIKSIIQNDAEQVDLLIRKNLHSDVMLISKVSEYIINSGGKRIRPLIVLLAARALNYEKEEHITAAAIIEFIHTATLLHDDVVDESKKRRGQQTANTVFGNQASVLIGDFLYSRAFQMMVTLDNMNVMGVLANATNMIATGEVMQLTNVYDASITEEQYFEVIYRKTSCLFEAGCHVSAILADCDHENDFSMMIEYGKNLGTAFQIIDDAMDYMASEEEIGKNLGDDLSEGKPTLPIIHAIKMSEGDEKKMLQSAIEGGDIDKLEAIQNVISKTGAIEYTTKKAVDFSNRAIESLSNLKNSVYKEALISIAQFSVDRNS